MVVSCHNSQSAGLPGGAVDAFAPIAKYWAAVCSVLRTPVSCLTGILGTNYLR